MAGHVIKSYKAELFYLLEYGFKKIENWIGKSKIMQLKMKNFCVFFHNLIYHHMEVHMPALIARRLWHYVTIWLYNMAILWYFYIDDLFVLLFFLFLCHLKEYLKALKSTTFCAGLWIFSPKLWTSRICKTCDRQFVKVWHIYFYKLSIAWTIVHAIFRIYAFFIMITLLVPHFIRINFIGRIQLY